MRRTCWSCKRTKSLISFSRDKNRIAGRKYSCKKCCAERSVIYRKNNRVKLSKYSLRRYHRSRRTALEIVGRGKLVCKNCGCDKIKLLEINHIHGGGRKEFSKRGNSLFYLDIIAKRRKIVDLNILCRLCNWLHYLQQKYGKLSYKISFSTKSLV